MGVFIDDDFLNEVGFVFKNDAERKQKSEELSTELESMVGGVIIDGLTDDQIDEFETLLEASATEEEKLSWLKKNYPSYEDVVNEQFNVLKKQLKSDIIKANKDKK